MGSAPRAPLPAARGSANVWFVNLGATGVVVRATVTGTDYRFETAGARVAVDPRDRPQLAATRGLRQVS